MVVVERAQRELGAAHHPGEQMPPLSPEELNGLKEELAAGTTPTVWFTAAAVGVPEGRSGKVIALADPEEGDFIQVRPAGSKDVLSFSAAEVTTVRPARKRAGKTTASAKAGSGAPTTSASTPRSRAAEPAKPATTTTPSKTSTPKQQPKQSAGTKTTGTTGRKTRRQPSGATVTLTADGEGQWTVEVTTGKKRVMRPTAVPASAVARAAKELHTDVAAAVQPLIDSAREKQRARVEQLQAELAAAQRVLDELTE